MRIFVVQDPASLTSLSGIRSPAQESGEVDISGNPNFVSADGVPWTGKWLRLSTVNPRSQRLPPEHSGSHLRRCICWVWESDFDHDSSSVRHIGDEAFHGCSDRKHSPWDVGCWCQSFYGSELSDQGRWKGRESQGGRRCLVRQEMTLLVWCSPEKSGIYEIPQPRPLTCTPSTRAGS